LWKGSKTDDIDKLSKVLSAQFANVKLKDDFGWKCPPLDVLDAVLSLNRRYEGFVLPRVYTFKRNHPDTIHLVQLLEMIERYPSPLLFSKQELNYNDEKRAETITNVVNRMLQVLEKSPVNSELEQLRVWAIFASPQDTYTFGVKGFGIAGFQYLRMLLGAQTTKPDVHITSFISGVTGRKVNQDEAILLLEQAARKIGLPVRLIDNAIWKKRSDYQGLYD
jgi:hypothetical protein